MKSTAGFYKDPWGVVHLKGAIQRTGGTQYIFELPAGYLPAKDLCLPTVRAAPLPPAATYLCINTAGDVGEQGLLTPGEFLLDGLTFRAG